MTTPQYTQWQYENALKVLLQKVLALRKRRLHETAIRAINRDFSGHAVSAK